MRLQLRRFDKGWWEAKQRKMHSSVLLQDAAEYRIPRHALGRKVYMLLIRAFPSLASATDSTVGSHTSPPLHASPYTASCSSTNLGYNGKTRDEAQGSLRNSKKSCHRRRTHYASGTSSRLVRRAGPLSAVGTTSQEFTQLPNHHFLCEVSY